MQWAHYKVISLRAMFAERGQTARLKRLRVPFAFNGIHRLATVRHNEIHFALLLVAPEMNFRQTRRDERVEGQVFPKRPAILRTQMIPAARVANHARVKPEHLGLRDNLAPSTRGKRTDHM